MGKIQCMCLIYFDINTIKQTLASLTKYSDRLDINIIENRSKYTELDIKPYILSLIDEGKIQRYFLFDENITNNAFEMIMDSRFVDWNNEFTIITDGDVVPQDGWIDEEINILNKCPEVFACAVDMDFANCYDKNARPPPDPNRTLIYKDMFSSHVLVMCRTKELRDFVLYRRRVGCKWLDTSIDNYARTIGKKFVRTRQTNLVHLTWTTYSDPTNEYTILKFSKSLDEFWLHNEYCTYDLYTKDGIEKGLKREQF